MSNGFVKVDKKTLEEMKLKVVEIYHTVFEPDKRYKAKLATIDLLQLIENILGKPLDLKEGGNDGGKN